MQSEKDILAEDGSLLRDDIVSFGADYCDTQTVLAWELLSKYGLIAGKRGQEDSKGRAYLNLLEAGEAVDRCWDLARLFLEKADDHIVEGTTKIRFALAAHQAKLERAKSPYFVKQDEFKKEA
jgi:hypothetical protein